MNLIQVECIMKREDVPDIYFYTTEMYDGGITEHLFNYSFLPISYKELTLH
jgi:hypothetical protein